MSTEKPRSLWIHKVTPGTFEFLMLRHPLERCESYFNFRLVRALAGVPASQPNQWHGTISLKEGVCGVLQGDERKQYAYMQNMTFTEWLESTLQTHRAQSCTEYYFRCV